MMYPLHLQNTLLIICESACQYFPLVLGAYITIALMKIPDLSIEIAYMCGAIIGTRMLIFTNTWPLIICFPVTIIASAIGGMLVGLCASTLTHKAKFPHLLSSIITIGIFHGLNQFFLGTSNVSLTSKRNLMGLLGQMVSQGGTGVLGFVRRYPELPQFIIAFLLFAYLGYRFLCTQLGTSLTVYGDNPRLFSHYGISTKYIFFTGILISNGLAGLAGFFDVQASGFIDINMSAMKTLFCINAIIIGKTLVNSKKPYSIWVPIVGSFVYFFIMQFLLKVDFNLKYFTMVQSLLVAGILAYKFQHNRRSGQQLGI